MCGSVHVHAFSHVHVHARISRVANRQMLRVHMCVVCATIRGGLREGGTGCVCVWAAMLFACTHWKEGGPRAGRKGGSCWRAGGGREEQEEQQLLAASIPMQSLTGANTRIACVITVSSCAPCSPLTSCLCPVCDTQICTHHIACTSTPPLRIIACRVAYFSSWPHIYARVCHVAAAACASTCCRLRRFAYSLPTVLTSIVV